jgi:hypothetical protein
MGGRTGRSLLLLSGLWLGSCSEPAVSASSGGAPPTLTLEPPAPLDAAPAVLRLRISGLDVDPRSLFLVDGDIGSYHRARIRSGELPAAIAARRVPALGWSDSVRGDIVLAPSAPLVNGGTYGVASLGLGTVSTLTVAPPPPTALAARLWPPADGAPGGVRWVFCGAALPPAAPLLAELEPGRIQAAVGPGADAAGTAGDRCFHFDASVAPGAGLVVPPPEVGGVALAPAPVLLAAGPIAGPARCAPDEVALGSGCARILDDRAVLRAGGAALLFTVRLPSGEVVEPTPANRRSVVLGLEPASLVPVRGAVTDLSGHEQTFESTWETLAPLPHVALNEVLANPLGPESASEWIELVNHGRVPVDLREWSLGEADGRTVLPRGTLLPGAFALVVAEDFAVAPAEDVAPAPDTLVLRVPRFSHALSNSGEVLELLDPGGSRVSSFPAIAAPRAGVSVARRVPSSLDDDPDGFGPSVGERATPGWQNHIAAP